MPDKIRIILADDHALLRKNLSSLLERTTEFRVMGEAENGLELLDLLNSGLIPDLLILDLSMPKMSGIEALCRIKEKNYDFKTLVLTMHKGQDVLCRAFSAGADGFMLKDGMAKELLPALHHLIEGKIYISPFFIGELPDRCQIKAFSGQKLGLWDLKLL